MLAENTGKTAKQTGEDMDRDYYLTAADAKDYGIIDKVVDSLKS